MARKAGSRRVAVREYESSDIPTGRSSGSHTDRKGRAKIAVGSKGEAEVVASEQGNRVVVYVCNECGGWHLGGGRRSIGWVK
jgi:hypothetical protein